MQRYLTCQGLANADSRKAVIDLGHYGSLQASIAALIEIERLHGYYFVTYEDAASRLRLSVLILRDAAQSVANERRCNLNVCGGFDEPNVAP